MKIFKKIRNLKEDPIWQIPLKFKKWILSWGILELIISLVGIAVPFFAKLKIDQLEKQNSNFLGFSFDSAESLFIIIVASEAATLFFIKVVSDLKRRLENKIQHGTRIQTHLIFYRKFLSFDYGILNNPKVSRLLWSIFGFSYSVIGIISYIFDQFRFLVLVFGVGAVVLIVDPQILVIIAVLGIFTFILRSRKLKSTTKLDLGYETIYEKYNQTERLLNDNFHKLMISGGSGDVINKFEDIQNEKWKQDTKRFWLGEKYEIVDSAIMISGMMAIFVILGQLVFENKITLGTYSMVMSYSTQLNSVISGLDKLKGGIIGYRMDFVKIGFLASVKSKLKLGRTKPEIKSLSGGIELKNIKFGYPKFSDVEASYLEKRYETLMGRAKSERQKSWVERQIGKWKKDFNKPSPTILESVSLKFETGKVTALIGRNGSGKTTITNLVLRGYDPDAGSVLVGDQDLVEVDPEIVRKSISILQQEPFWMDTFTVRENLIFGANRSVSDEEVFGVLRELKIDDLVKRHPKGLDATKGDDFELSGGQKQLMNIARIFIQDRPIMIFDEGTNQLDAEREAEVFDLIKSRKKDRVIIFITHRITTAKKSDFIYAIDDGKVIESGDHRKLVKNGGVYQKFWEKQVG